MATHDPLVDAPGTPSVAGMRASTSVMLDCRWLGHGGAGRITELLLLDLVAEPPDGYWTLWGDPRLLDGLAFRGSTIAPWEGYPPRLFGQWDLLRVPPADVHVYLHQIRPLRGGHVVTMIYDTTPLTTATNPLIRAVKRLYFRLSARRSRVILTLSNGSRRSIASDLRVSVNRILVTHPPIDEARAARLRNLRVKATVEPMALYVGRFGAHKNLRRLASAFQATRLCAAGGMLLLVGGTPGETRTLADWVEAQGLSGVEVRPACSEEELDRLMVTSAVLAAPSLMEGYGLPAFEAASIGLPVAVSRAGAMGDLPEDVAEFLDPLDESSIAAAIDRAAARGLVPAYVPTGDLRSTVVSAVRIAAS